MHLVKNEISEISPQSIHGLDCFARDSIAHHSAFLSRAWLSYFIMLRLIRENLKCPTSIKYHSIKIFNNVFLVVKNVSFSYLFAFSFFESLHHLNKFSASRWPRPHEAFSKSFIRESFPIRFSSRSFSPLFLVVQLFARLIPSEEITFVARNVLSWLGMVKPVSCGSLEFRGTNARFYCLSYKWCCCIARSSLKEEKKKKSYIQKNVYLLICVISKNVSSWFAFKEKQNKKKKQRSSIIFQLLSIVLRVKLRIKRTRFSGEKRAKQNCAQKGFLSLACSGRFEVRKLLQCSLQIPSISIFSNSNFIDLETKRRLKKLSAAWRWLSLKQLITFNGSLSKASQQNAKDIRLQSAPRMHGSIQSASFFSIQSFSIVRASPYKSWPCKQRADM